MYKHFMNNKSSGSGSDPKRKWRETAAKGICTGDPIRSGETSNPTERERERNGIRERDYVMGIGNRERSGYWSVGI